ncbi:MAG: hypothetical protein JWP81_4288 [Ferruginibacter sp.]|nr:hypothetical protein [Ferruginibacter sp.]
MKFSFKSIHLSKLFICLAMVLLAGIYSCNDSDSKTEKEVPPPTSSDTTMKTSDTTMTMKTDTLSDTTGKGGQPTPTGH